MYIYILYDALSEIGICQTKEIADQYAALLGCKVKTKKLIDRFDGRKMFCLRMDREGDHFFFDIPRLPGKFRYEKGWPYYVFYVPAKNEDEAREKANAKRLELIKDGLWKSL